MAKNVEDNDQRHERIAEALTSLLLSENRAENAPDVSDSSVLSTIEHLNDGVNKAKRSQGGFKTEQDKIEEYIVN